MDADSHGDRSIADFAMTGLDIDILAMGGVDPVAPIPEVDRAARETLGRIGVKACHLAIEFVDEERIHLLNREHRDRDKPTDVLSFPVDGVDIAVDGPLPSGGEPLELGDVVICPAHTENIVEAVVHGILHLCGFDHETDEGEMLTLQDQIVDGLR